MSKRLSAKSIVPFVEGILRKTIDSLRQLPDTLAAVKYYVQYKPWAFYFSDPIYLRKKTILIYYFMYYNNNGGEEDVWVCKKSSLQWIKLGVLGGGAW